MDISHVRGFISRESPKHVSNKINLTWPVKKFLHYLRDNTLTDINADLFLANPVPARRKVLPCLEDSEIQAIFDEVDLGSPRGKRDYAIIRLALDTGLRWSDIASLKLSEIDWRKKEISVRQEKTGTALKLPLTVEAVQQVKFPDASGKHHVTVPVQRISPSVRGREKFPRFPQDDGDTPNKSRYPSHNGFPGVGAYQP